MVNENRTYGELVVTLTTEYNWMWSDKGSGATRSAAFWHPKPQGNLRALGTIAVDHFSEIRGRRATLLVGQNPDAEPLIGKPAVASPTGYTLIATDKESGADSSGSFWRPVAPAGYVSLGDVANTNWGEPSKDQIWCLRRDLTVDANFTNENLWDDSKSGGVTDISVWNIVPYPTGVHGSKNIPIVAGTFRAKRHPLRAAQHQ